MPGTDIAVTQKKQPEKSVSWGEIDWMIEVGVAKMREIGFLPSRIIPIGGGGLIPASIMAYRLYKKSGVPIQMLPPVYARSYSAEHQQGRLSVDWSFDPEAYDATTTLLVDDIIDTGRTLWAIKERLPLSPCFAIVTKLKELSLPNGKAQLWWSTLDKRNHWWIFPWEKEVPENVGPQSAT
jgi:hypoxanthine phosphoribosyltransferase